MGCLKANTQICELLTPWIYSICTLHYCHGIKEKQNQAVIVLFLNISLKQYLHHQNVCYGLQKENEYQSIYIVRLF